MKFPLFLTTLNVSRLVIIGSYLLFNFFFLLFLHHHHIHSIFSISIFIFIFIFIFISISIPSSPSPSPSSSPFSSPSPLSSFLPLIFIFCLLPFSFHVFYLLSSFLIIIFLNSQPFNLILLFILVFHVTKREKSIIIIRCNLFLVQKDLMLINKILDLD